jgi:glycosyltransferase involved in cell wall biosynthesis
MALGVPVVAVRSGGAIPEVVGEAAVLAPSGSVDDIASAIRQLLDDPALMEQLKAAGLQQVQHFQPRRHAQRVLEVYRNVLQQR